LEMPSPKSVRDSEAYAELVLSLEPVVYYRMERPKKGTATVLKVKVKDWRYARFFSRGS